MRVTAVFLMSSTTTSSQGVYSEFLFFSHGQHVMSVRRNAEIYHQCWNSAVLIHQSVHYFIYYVIMDCILNM